MKTQQNNVHSLTYNGIKFTQPEKPVIQATLIFDEETGEGMITIVGDNINGGEVLCLMQPEIVESIRALIKEANDTIGPEYA